MLEREIEQRTTNLAEWCNADVLGRRTGVDVVDCHTAVGCTGKVICNLRYLDFASYRSNPPSRRGTHSDETPIPMLEVEHGGPVVGLILLEATTGARGELAYIALRGIHGNIEPTRTHHR